MDKKRKRNLSGASGEKRIKKKRKTIRKKSLVSKSKASSSKSKRSNRSRTSKTNPINITSKIEMKKNLGDTNVYLSTLHKAKTVTFKTRSQEKSPERLLIDILKKEIQSQSNNACGSRFYDNDPMVCNIKRNSAIVSKLTMRTGNVQNGSGERERPHPNPIIRFREKPKESKQSVKNKHLVSKAEKGTLTLNIIDEGREPDPSNVPLKVSHLKVIRAEDATEGSSAENILHEVSNKMQPNSFQNDILVGSVHALEFENKKTKSDGFNNPKHFDAKRLDSTSLRLELEYPSRRSPTRKNNDLSKQYLINKLTAIQQKESFGNSEQPRRELSPLVKNIIAESSFHEKKSSLDIVSVLTSKRSRHSSKQSSPQNNSRFESNTTTNDSSVNGMFIPNAQAQRRSIDIFSLLKTSSCDRKNDCVMEKDTQNSENIRSNSPKKTFDMRMGPEKTDVYTTQQPSFHNGSRSTNEENHSEPQNQSKEILLNRSSRALRIVQSQIISDDKGIVEVQTVSESRKQLIESRLGKSVKEIVYTSELQILEVKELSSEPESAGNSENTETKKSSNSQVNEPPNVVIEEQASNMKDEQTSEKHENIGIPTDEKNDIENNRDNSNHQNETTQDNIQIFTTDERKADLNEWQQDIKHESKDKNQNIGSKEEVSNHLDKEIIETFQTENCVLNINGEEKLNTSSGSLIRRIINSQQELPSTVIKPIQSKQEKNLLSQETLFKETNYGKSSFIQPEFQLRSPENIDEMKISTLKESTVERQIIDSNDQSISKSKKETIVPSVSENTETKKKSQRKKSTSETLNQTASKLSKLITIDLSRNPSPVKLGSLKQDFKQKSNPLVIKTSDLNISVKVISDSKTNNTATISPAKEENLEYELNSQIISNMDSVPDLTGDHRESLNVVSQYLNDVLDVVNKSVCKTKTKNVNNLKTESKDNGIITNNSVINEVSTSAYASDSSEAGYTSNFKSCNCDKRRTIEENILEIGIIIKDYNTASDSMEYSTDDYQ